MIVSSCYFFSLLQCPALIPKQTKSNSTLIPCTGPNPFGMCQFKLPSLSSLFFKTYSFRRSLPQGENFHGPGHDGVRHYWQDATENLGNQHQHQQYPRHQSQSQPTIINRMFSSNLHLPPNLPDSMYGSRLDPVQVQMVFPAISDHPNLPQHRHHHHHQFHYNNTLSTSPSNRNSRRSIGKSEPSALFYDNSGSHLVIP